jgi:hypothetical protein
MRTRRRSPVEIWRELCLPRDERRAARAERAVEERLRAERDSPYRAEQRAAKLEAERRRYDFLGR